MKTATITATLLIANLFGVGASLPAHAVDGKQFAVFQKKVFPNKRKDVEAESHANWTTRDKMPGVHLVNERPDIASAWIIDLPPNTQVKKFSFKVQKFERGIIWKDTVDPIVRLEYHSRSNPTLQYSTVPRSDMSPDVDGQVVCKLHPVAGEDPVITRIAVCAVAITKQLPYHFADMDLWYLKVNDQPVTMHTELTVKDGGKDRLIDPSGY